MQRSKSKEVRIVLSNHKGGVGKTTLTINIAHALGALGKRVLIVDSDPQCNLTSHLFADDVVDKLLENSDKATGRTIWTSLKPIVEAEGTYKKIRPYDTALENVYLIPGDIRLSEYEEALVGFWGDCFQRKTKGYRGLTALSLLVSDCAKSANIDYVFYDSGPNIGPLNRSIYLDCDYFIVPAACDLFSVRALKTLGKTIGNWIHAWKLIHHFAPDEYRVLSGNPKLLGYIPQRFKVYGGQMTSSSRSFVNRIEKGIHNDILKVIKTDELIPLMKMKEARLGEVKDFSPLVQYSQEEGTALAEVRQGETYQKNEAREIFTSIAKKIIPMTKR